MSALSNSAHCADDLEHEPTRGGAQVQVVAEANKGDPIRAKIGQNVGKVLERLSKAVDLLGGTASGPVSIGSSNALPQAVKLFATATRIVARCVVS